MHAGGVNPIQLLLSLASLAFSLPILIHAFKKSVGTGFMTLCIPCYILYYAFAEFQHEKKNLIIAGWLICGVLSGVVGVMTRGGY